MQKKKSNSEEILGIASLIYATFFTIGFIKPIGKYINPIVDKLFEIQPFKEGWFIVILVFLYFWAVIISFVYLKILYDRFTEEKQIVSCSNSSCKGKIRITKYKEGFVRCPHCSERFYTRT
jgi:fucose permease